ncbi:GtrA family protein [Streptomyces sp. V1I6]|uniref:GtrA family protein n=1 Tax=Streptomyces sp. V1I6 TaxID=3042273 RepID=UPI002788B329|nr:GtrA family protein [Streptomyces sp. V1I6]MDQ0843803.1 putative flippase GtrA [Streptomyces sp. V1I6]
MRTDTPWGTLPAREHLLAGAAALPVLDVVIPVFNEETDLERCVVRLHEHLTRTFPYGFRITVADNASTDRTPEIAARLEAGIAEVVLAERAGLRIHEVPVDWVDDPDSSVHIVSTAAEDLKGVWRVGRALAVGALPLERLARPFGDDPRDREISGVPRGLARQLVGFCVVGVFSTLLFLLLYSLFRTGAGPQTANAAALLLSAVANTAANRRLTFGVRGRDHAVRHQAQGLVVFGIGLALTSGSLAALDAAAGGPSHGTELAVLVAANLAATVLRFLLFRAWVFPERHRAHDDMNDMRYTR